MKSQRGSISLFMLVALLFYTGFLLLLYASNVNKVQTVTEKLNSIKSIYSKNVNNTDEVYNRAIKNSDKVEPIINDIPTSIIVNVTQLQEDQYVEYGVTGGDTEYKAFDQTFSTLGEVVNYVSENNLYGTCNLRINAYGNNGLTSYKDIQIQILQEENNAVSENTVV